MDNKSEESARKNSELMSASKSLNCKNFSEAKRTLSQSKNRLDVAIENKVSAQSELHAFLEESERFKGKQFAVRCREEMKYRHINTPNAFSRKTNISNSNIFYKLHEDDGYIPSFPFVIAILIGLSMPHDIWFSLLASAGYSLNETKLHMIYKFALDRRMKIETVNSLLEMEGFEALGERHTNNSFPK